MDHSVYILFGLFLPPKPVIIYDVTGTVWVQDGYECYYNTNLGVFKSPEECQRYVYGVHHHLHSSNRYIYRIHGFVVVITFYIVSPRMHGRAKIMRLTLMVSVL